MSQSYTMSQLLDIKFTRGDSYTLNVQYESSSGGVLTPIDITTADIYFTVKKFKTDSDPGLFQLTVGAGIIKSATPTDGKFTVVIPKSATKLLDFGVAFVYDCVIEIAGGRDTVIAGTLTVDENVTDA